DGCSAENFRLKQSLVFFTMSSCFVCTRNTQCKKEEFIFHHFRYLKNMVSENSGWNDFTSHVWNKTLRENAAPIIIVNRLKCAEHLSLNISLLSDKIILNLCLSINECYKLDHNFANFWEISKNFKLCVLLSFVVHNPGLIIFTDA
ncbi:Hypothetical protein CINCED_3A001712, partial [Cinara cedri]